MGGEAFERRILSPGRITETETIIPILLP